MFKDINIIQQLETIAEILPSPVYWLDLNNVVVGANTLALNAIGASCSDEIIGKAVHDFCPKELVECVVKHNQEVVTTGVRLCQEEAIQDLQTREIRYYIASKMPLRNDNGEIIGLVCTSTEITVEREAETLSLEKLRKNNILKHLESLASLFPIPVYWNNLESGVLGGNQHIIAGIGLKSAEDVLGKTPYEFYPLEIAERIVKHNEEVIRTGQIRSQEESIVDLTTGRLRYYNAYKAPLRDENGTIFGTLGISIETTAEKEAQQLENERQQFALQEKEKFIATVQKVAHDINSPLASLKMTLDQCGDLLPEDRRLTLKNAVTRIIDITNNLMNTYKKEKKSASGEELSEALLISDLLVQLLSEKRAQYCNHPVKIEADIDVDAQFAFVQMQPSQFTRTISNLINNAVEALENKNGGKVTINLKAYTNFVMVTVQDNGKGMSPIMLEKMLKRQKFSEGKENGNGIGLQQVWDTLDNNDGALSVDSSPGEGTAIQLGFRRIVAANWIAKEIRPEANSIVVILDDDESIHGAWDARFKPYLESHPKLRSQHFTQGQDALDFFSTLNSAERDRVIFLSDYELLRQDKNGLQIIEESRIENSTLVTSYYANSEIREKATQLGVRILPKQMASVVPITIETKPKVS